MFAVFIILAILTDAVLQGAKRAHNEDGSFQNHIILPVQRRAGVPDINRWSMLACYSYSLHRCLLDLHPVYSKQKQTILVLWFDPKHHRFIHNTMLHKNNAQIHVCSGHWFLRHESRRTIFQCQSLPGGGVKWNLNINRNTNVTMQQV